MTIRILASFLLSLSLLGCAFGDGEGSKSQNARDQRERDELIESFSLVKGTYAGILKDGFRDEPVELVFYVQDELTGQRDSQGRPITRPALFARLKTTEIVRYDARLSARYYEESGEIVMFAQTAAPQAAFTMTSRQTATSTQIKSIQGFLNRGASTFSGEVLGAGGTIGTLEVSLVSRESRIPSAGEEVETNERLRRQFEVVKGTWEGILQDGQRPESVQVVFFIQDERSVSQQGEVITRPVLYARLRTQDIVRYDFTYSTRYRPEIAEIVLFNANTEIQSITGRFTDSETFRGSAGTARGTLGEINLKRVSTETPAPGQGEENDRNERLRRQYEPLVGKYVGTLTGASNPNRPELKGFTVELFLTTQSTANGGSIPVLNGHYKLPSGGGGLDLSFAVIYKPELSPPQITMTSQGVVTRPGNYFVTLEGTLQPNGDIKGAHVTQMGTTGSFTLKRVPAKAR